MRQVASWHYAIVTYARWVCISTVNLKVRHDMWLITTCPEAITISLIEANSKVIDIGRYWSNKQLVYGGICNNITRHSAYIFFTLSNPDTWPAFFKNLISFISRKYCESVTSKQTHNTFLFTHIIHSTVIGKQQSFYPGSLCSNWQNMMTSGMVSRKQYDDHGKCRTFRFGYDNKISYKYIISST